MARRRCPSLRSEPEPCLRGGKDIHILKEAILYFHSHISDFQRDRLELGCPTGEVAEQGTAATMECHTRDKTILNARLLEDTELAEVKTRCTLVFETFPVSDRDFRARLGIKRPIILLFLLNPGFTTDTFSRCHQTARIYPRYRRDTGRETRYWAWAQA